MFEKKDGQKIGEKNKIERLRLKRSLKDVSICRYCVSFCCNALLRKLNLEKSFFAFVGDRNWYR